MRHYCALFDSKYLPQGLVLYESLKRHSSEEFTLYVLPMDEECAETLFSMVLPNVQLVLGFHEMYTGMKEARANRSYREYCWSCASCLCEALIEMGIDECTYLDADTCFLNNPAPVFEEIGDRSIAITPHQFPDNPEKPRLLKSGIYNVGLIHFKNTDAGRRCLKQWANDVRHRCSAEIGCGDQGYLDFFERDYGSEVCILGHGINAGPWNLMAYEVRLRDRQIYLGESPLIHFHFHEYVHRERLTNYPLRQIDKDLIYAPYVAACNASLAQIEAAKHDKDGHRCADMESRSSLPIPAMTVSGHHA